MSKSRIRVVLTCCTGLVLCFAMTACDDASSSITWSTPVAAKVKPPAPQRQKFTIYSMALTLEDRAGDAVLSDGAGPYLDGDGAIVHLADLKDEHDQIAIKSGPGPTSRDGWIRIALAGLDEQCGNFQLRVYSSSELLDLPVGNLLLGTGSVLCVPGNNKKDVYQIEIDECVVVHRVAAGAWHVASDADCIGRLDHSKDTMGRYGVPFAFQAVLK